MNSYFNKLTSICFTLFISLSVFAQKDFQGKAYYKSKTTMDMSNFGGGQLSEERKKQIAQRMKSMLEKTYILTFNKTESIYEEDESLEAPGQGRGRFGMMSSFTGGDQYKNVKEQLLLQDQEFFGKQFLIKDALPKLNWVMGNETKQVGQYMCFKATATKVSTDFDFSSFRRPTNSDNEKKEEDEKPNEIEIVAWYTMQIPISQGPGDYWGLPGLILEINSGRTTVLCSKIILNPEEKVTIKAPSKGKEVTKAEYDKIVKKKTEEMRDNFRNRGGGRPGGRGRG